MQEKIIINYIKNVLEHLPNNWIGLTTHRLDIYNEKLAKTQFLSQFNHLFKDNNYSPTALSALPTAYDYIRLGHPLSCVLEWTIANLNRQDPECIISFSSKTMPVLAILRKNLLDHKKTQILYTGDLPAALDADLLKNKYCYTFELKQIDDVINAPSFNGSTIFISKANDLSHFDNAPNIDFFVNINAQLGSVLLVNGEENKSYINAIQHVRRRETVAMTPADCLDALKICIGQVVPQRLHAKLESDKALVLSNISDITQTTIQPLVGSSGLSIQYAIMMGLIDDAQQHHRGKAIKFIVPTNCYGGTNDQARRVAACHPNVEVVDLEVDGDHDMVTSIAGVLDAIAQSDAVPYIIAEIPTNPRVEVPDLMALKAVLNANRSTSTGEKAIGPVFILDQTFCPNIPFLGEGELLSSITAISYASGSKFPSGGRCTAGYCVGNDNAEALMATISKHLKLCDNEATNLQYEILAQQLPSMKQRIQDAYENTREFVNFIEATLPAAKINFVSESLAKQGFTPSVFSLDLPAKGHTPEQKEANKRALNHKLIELMITKIPDESKYCVSYGQLYGCYWTIPATSTQGTTKEGDKDYIARVAVSPNLNLERHKNVFLEFTKNM